MKAIVQDRYGSPEVLRLEEMSIPALGDDDALVRLLAAPVAATTALQGLRDVGRVQPGQKVQSDP